jgi:hypothetical protein
LVGTLPFEVFSEVLAKLHSGMSAKSIDLGGKGDRLRNIRFCLLATKQERDRDFMKSDATMVLLRDGKAWQIVASVRSSNSEVGGPTGYLGSLCGTMALEPQRI